MNFIANKILLGRNRARGEREREGEREGGEREGEIETERKATSQI